MKLISLYLHHFRNYKNTTIHFSPKLNYIYGENGEGKTNLLEAIHLLITGRSFRTHQLSNLVGFESSSFYIEAHFEKNGVEQQLKLSFDGEKRQVIHNSTPLSSLSSLLGMINGVIISPEDHNLIKGGPRARRQFLDLQIACESPLYLHHLSSYLRALKQRNVLLRQNQVATISIWEEKMAESASHLVEKRLQTIEQLTKEEAIENQTDNLQLNYYTSAPMTKNRKEIQEFFLIEYRDNRPRELERGSTLIGPHRDDMKIDIQGRDARIFASEGQSRSLVTSLRLAQWGRMKKEIKDTPILCVDDVGISLDASREKNLYKTLNTLGQVFITSPRTNKDLPLDTQLISIKSGQLTS